MLPRATAGDGKLSINNIDHGSFTPTGHIVAYGLDGDDDIPFSGSIPSTWPFGDAGNDRLKGDNGNNVLVGGAGDDLRNAGSVDFGATGLSQDQALCPIMDEWSSTRSYSTRLANLRVRLLATDGPARTVLDDDREGILTDSSGLDWSLVNLNGTGVRDRVTDLKAAEFADDLDVIHGNG